MFSEDLDFLWDLPILFTVKTGLHLKHLDLSFLAYDLGGKKGKILRFCKKIIFVTNFLNKKGKILPFRYNWLSRFYLNSRFYCEKK